MWRAFHTANRPERGSLPFGGGALALPRRMLPLEHCRTLPVGTPPEGMAAGNRVGHTYISEEDVGTWRCPLSPTGGGEATDSAGPWRLVTPGGGTLRRLRYRVHGVEKTPALGGYSKWPRRAG